MKLILILLGLFIALESINAMRLVDAKLLNLVSRYFMATKHVLSALSGLVVAWYAYNGDIETEHLLFALAIFVFILAEALYRWAYLLQKNNPNIYYYVIGHLDLKLRRKSDEAVSH